MELTKENIIFTSENRRAIYYRMLQLPNNNIRLYSNRWVKHHDTIFVNSANGIDFDFINHTTLKKSGATHNFFPFIGQDGMVYGIGGIDNWKHDNNFHQIKDYETWKIAYEDKFKKPCDPKVFELEEHRRLLANKQILNHTDGLYLFTSKNGAEWKEVQKIITVEHEGYINAIVNFGKGSEFDGMVNCLWNEGLKEYVLYLRANINPGFRFIQYATSKDLLTWSKFKLINIDSYVSTIDNYYIPCFMPYKKVYIGMVPYFNETSCSIRLMKSLDGITWNIKDKWFIEKNAMFKDGKPKNTCHVVNGIFVRKGTVNIYIHHNNLGLDSMKPVNIVRYTVSEKEFDKVLCL